MAPDLENLKNKIQQFARDRDWEQFHSPKNLAMSVAAEAGELLEIFMWLTEEQSHQLSAEQKNATSDEIADVLIGLINLSSKLGIDMIQVAHAKLEKNSQKYPISKSRGNAKKYDQL